MSEYLQFHTGPYRFLLAVEHVVEIGDAGAAVAEATVSGWRQWRERSLPVVSLARFVGATAGARPQQIVLGSEAEGFSVVDVDGVDGLVELGESEFAHLSDLSPGLGALVDAVAVAADGRHSLLRLRQPFAWGAELSRMPEASGLESLT